MSQRAAEELGLCPKSRSGRCAAGKENLGAGEKKLCGISVDWTGGAAARLTAFTTALLPRSGWLASAPAAPLVGPLVRSVNSELGPVLTDAGTVILVYTTLTRQASALFLQEFI